MHIFRIFHSPHHCWLSYFIVTVHCYIYIYHYLLIRHKIRKKLIYRKYDHTRNHRNIIPHIKTCLKLRLTLELEPKQSNKQKDTIFRCWNFSQAYLINGTHCILYRFANSIMSLLLFMHTTIWICIWWLQTQHNNYYYYFSLIKHI